MIKSVFTTTTKKNFFSQLETDVSSAGINSHKKTKLMSKCLIKMNIFYCPFAVYNQLWSVS